MTQLSDGVYSVFVIDAEEIDKDTTRLEVTITIGEHKGEIVAVRASHLDGDPLLMMGLPATLFVDGGMPRIELER